MIRWFLRLFLEFAEMEQSLLESQSTAAACSSDLSAAREELERLNAENLRLQDRLNAALEDRTRLWEMTRESISAERLAYQSHINVQWQRTGHGTPYPDAPHIPVSAVPKADQEPIPRRELGSEAVARMTRQFSEELVDKLLNK